MTGVADGYGKYYHKGADGQSVYSRRFGPYPVPLKEVIVLTEYALAKLGYRVFKPNEPGVEDYTRDLAKRLDLNHNLTPHEFYTKIISDLFKKAGLPEKMADVTMLDFGCGDGRFLIYFQSLAACMAARGGKVNLIGYEISAEGLSVYKDILNNQEFRQSGAVYSNGNLNITFVEGNENDAPSVTGRKITSAAREAFGNKEKRPVDVTLSMFGVFAHITNDVVRQGLIKSLEALTNHTIIWGLPTLSYAYGDNIKVTRFDEKTRIAHYEKIFDDGTKTEFPYLLYDHAFLAHDLKRSGLSTEEGKLLFLSRASFDRPNIASQDVDSALNELQNTFFGTALQPKAAVATLESGFFGESSYQLAIYSGFYTPSVDMACML